MFEASYKRSSNLLPIRSNLLPNSVSVSVQQMATRLLLLAVLLLFFCVSQQGSSDTTEAQEHQTLVVKGANRRLLPFMDCKGLCKVRCSLHSRPNVCNRACGTCCVRCRCVPPGTSGNRELCGKCYTEMTTHDNRPKCP